MNDEVGKPVLDYARPTEDSPKQTETISKAFGVFVYSSLSLTGLVLCVESPREVGGIVIGALIAVMGAGLALATIQSHP